MPETLLVGVWSAPGVRLVATTEGAAFEKECVVGRTKHEIALDSAGSFSVQGTWMALSGTDPIVSNVRYSGRVRGEVLELSIYFNNGVPFTVRYTLREGDRQLTRCQ